MDIPQLTAEFSVTTNDPMALPRGRLFLNNFFLRINTISTYKLYFRLWRTLKNCDLALRIQNHLPKNR